MASPTPTIPHVSNDEFARHIDELRTKFTNLCMAHTNELNVLREQIAMFNTKPAVAASASGENSAEVDKLKKELAARDESIKQLTAMSNELNAISKTNGETIKELETNIKAREGQIKEFTAKYEHNSKELEKCIMELKATLSAKDEQIKQLNTTITTQDGMIKQLQANQSAPTAAKDAADKDKTIADLNVQVQDMTKLMSNLAEQSKAKDQTITNMNAHVQFTTWMQQNQPQLMQQLYGLFTQRPATH